MRFPTTPFVDPEVGRPHVRDAGQSNFRYTPDGSPHRQVQVMFLSKIFPHFDTRPDFVGFAAFRTQYGTVDGLECGFFLPKSEVAKIWVLVRTRSLGDGPIALDWKFSCELTAGADLLLAEEIFHSGYTQWDWGNGVEDTLVGETTRLTVSRGAVDGSAVSRAGDSGSPVFSYESSTGKAWLAGILWGSDLQSSSTFSPISGVKTDLGSMTVWSPAF